MANGPRSAFSAKPSQLASPIPGENLDQEADTFLTSLEAPAEIEPPAVAPAVAPDLAQVAEPVVEPVVEEAQAEQFLTSLDAPQEIEADPIQNIRQSVSQQFDESFARLRRAFAVTGKERKQTLEDFFGAGNVKQEKGVDFVRRKPGGKFQKFDRDDLELVGDTLDFSRDIFEGVIENVARLGGFVGGAAEAAPIGAAGGAVVGTAGGPPGIAVGATTGAASAGFLGGTLGAAAAGGAGAIGALNAGDFVAQNLLGIERDPTRDRVEESKLAGALGAVFGGGTLLATRAVRKRIAARALKKQTEALEDFTPSNVRGTVDDGIEAVETLKRSGLVSETVAGRKVLVTPRQLDPTNPQLIELEDQVFSKQEGYRNFISEQGKVLSDAYTAIAGGAKRLLGREGAFREKIFDAKQIEGKTIGEFRTAALKATKGERQQLPGFREQVGRSLNEFVDPKSPGKILSAEDMAIEAPELSRSQAEFLRKRLLKFKEMSEKGASLKIVDSEYIALRGKIDQMIGTNTGRDLARRLIPLKNALEADRTELIGRELGGDAAKAYGVAKERFSSIMGSLQQINKSLLNENISQRALARGIFKQGPGGLPLARAIRNITQTSDPDLWKSLTNEYLLETLRQNTDEATRFVNWKSVKKTLDNLGPEMKKELTSGGQFNAKELDAVLKLGILSQESTRAFKATPGNKEIIRKGFAALVSRYAQATGVAEILGSLGKEKHPLITYLSQEGIDDIVRSVRPNQKAAVRNKIQQALDSLKDKVTRGAVVAGKAALPVSRAARAPVRREIAAPDEETRPRAIP